MVEMTGIATPTRPRKCPVPCEPSTGSIGGSSQNSSRPGSNEEPQSFSRALRSSSCAMYLLPFHQDSALRPVASTAVTCHSWSPIRSPPCRCAGSTLRGGRLATVPRTASLPGARPVPELAAQICGCFRRHDAGEVSPVRCDGGPPESRTLAPGNAGRDESSRWEAVDADGRGATRRASLELDDERRAEDGIQLVLPRVRRAEHQLRPAG